MVSIGGTEVENLDPVPDRVGRCTIFVDAKTHHLAVPPWYSTAIRVFDDSLFIAGGAEESVDVCNADYVRVLPEKSRWYSSSICILGTTPPSKFSPKVKLLVPFLWFADLYRAFVLPDGKVFIVADHRSVIYDERKIETPLPDIPNGIPVTYPIDGTTTLQYFPSHPSLRSPSFSLEVATDYDTPNV